MRASTRVAFRAETESGVVRRLLDQPVPWPGACFPVRGASVPPAGTGHRSVHSVVSKRIQMAHRLGAQRVIKGNLDPSPDGFQRPENDKTGQQLVGQRMNHI